MVRKSSSDCRQFARAGFHAFEQPHILDCDRGLVGEGGDQFDLFVGERPHFRARQDQDADRGALAQHRDGKNRAVIAQPLPFHQGVFWISLHVGDMNQSTFEQCAPGRRASFGIDWNISDIVHEFGREAVGLGTVESSVFLAGNGGLVGIAEPGCRFNESLQNCPQIKGRAADDLEHVGRGGLLLQRFTQLVKQARILDCDDGLCGEVLDKIDLFVGEGADFLAIDDDRADEFVLLQHRHGDV